MKLCFFIQNLDSGGAERIVAGFANYAVEKGYEVDVVLYQNKVFYELDQRINVSYLRDVSKDNNKLTRFLGRHIRKMQFKKYAKKHKPDVVFCLLFPAIYYANYKNRKFRLVGQEVSNPAWIKHPKALARKISYFSSTDKMIYQTERAREFYKDIDKPYVIIPNPICNNLVYEIPEISYAQRKNKIVAMGRFVPEKNYQTLVQAFKLVHDVHPEFTLEIFGNGPAKQQIQELVDQLDLTTCVKLNQSCPDALVKISDAKCYVMSSISEGMPNALMEAMAIGLPCVSTDCPNGPAELITNEENGLLVPVQQPQLMADAIIRMIEDESLNIKCGENARKAKIDYAQDVVFDKILDACIK